MERLKVLFLGNAYNGFSVACLKALLEAGHEVTAASGSSGAAGLAPLVRTALRTRGPAFVLRKGWTFARCQLRLGLRGLGYPLRGFASLSELARAHRLTTMTADRPNASTFVETACLLRPDVIVVAGFGHVLRRPLLDLPRLGSVNVHPSLLPRYRGPNPFYWVLARGEAATGVTVHYMDEGIDSGRIILQRELAILPGDTEERLLERSSVLAGPMLVEALELIARGAAGVPQDESAASYFSFPPRGASRL